MRGKGEGAVYRVPKDKTKPLQHWAGAVELPPGPNGERRRKVVRRKNKAELLRELSTLRAELETRGDLPTAGITVEKWFRYWLEHVVATQVRPNTLDGYKRTVENHIIPAIGKIRLEKVSPANVRRVHDAILSKGLSSTTALLAHRTMAVSFKAAEREGRIGRNPANLTDAPKKATTALQALTRDEALQLLTHHANSPQGALWATVLLTGARRGEVLGLERDRISDVLDLSWQLIRLPKTEQDGKPDVPSDYEYRHVTGGLYLTRPKSRSGWRVIPLIDPLKSILQRHLEQTPENEWGLVFLREPSPTNEHKTARPQPYSPDQAGKDWRVAVKQAGIDKDVRLHDGRHTTVDLLYAAGVPEDLISELVGHSARAVTQGYKSLRNRERLGHAMQLFSSHFSIMSLGGSDDSIQGNTDEDRTQIHARGELQG